MIKAYTPDDARNAEFKHMVDRAILHVNSILSINTFTNGCPINCTGHYLMYPEVRDYIIKIYNQQGWDVQYRPAKWFGIAKLIFRERKNDVARDMHEGF